MFSLFLISAFTTIQLNNQIQRARESDIYQARQEALVLHDKLKALFSNYDEKTSKSAVIDEVKNIFRSVLEGKAVETISLLDRDGYPVVLEGNLQLFFEDSKDFIREVTSADAKSRWVKPFVDKNHKLMNLFINFENPSGYILKLTFSLADTQKALSAVYIPVMITVLI
ncbi:MAG: hypothetical protein WC419_06630, partial [Candidatus Omnitrophota bacterium]